VVRSLWPRAQANLYGSFVTGLGLPWSDLDLVIWLPKVSAGVFEHQIGFQRVPFVYTSLECDLRFLLLRLWQTFIGEVTLL
jgi:predicted nucleotidyltransferase